MDGGELAPSLRSTQYIPFNNLVLGSASNPVSFTDGLGHRIFF